MFIAAATVLLNEWNADAARGLLCPSSVTFKRNGNSDIGFNAAINSALASDVRTNDVG